MANKRDETFDIVGARTPNRFGYFLAGHRQIFSFQPSLSSRCNDRAKTRFLKIIQAPNDGFWNRQSRYQLARGKFNSSLTILSRIEFNLTCFIFVERDFDAWFSILRVDDYIYKEVYNFLIDNIRTTLHRISFVIHFLSIMNRLSGLEGCKWRFNEGRFSKFHQKRYKLARRGGKIAISKFSITAIPSATTPSLSILGKEK